MTKTTPENLSIVINVIKEITSNLNGDAKKIASSKKNAVELLLLSDIAETLKPHKKAGVFDVEAIEIALTTKYWRYFGAGKASTFYNYRKVLEQKSFSNHLKTLL